MQGNVNDAPSSPVNSILGGLAIYALIVVLLVAIFLLPPIAAVDRVLSVGYTTIPAEEGGFVTAEDGAQLMLFPEGMQNDTKIRFTAIPRSRFLEGSIDNNRLKAAENIPLWLIMQSPYYEIRYRGRKPPGQAIIRVPVPADAEPTHTLDLYSWSGQSWRWLPHFIPPGGDFIETELDYLPASVVVMQTKPLQPAVSVDLPESTDVPEQALDTPLEINPEGLYLAGDGGIRGDAGALLRPDQTASNLVMPILRNWEDAGTVRSDLVDNMLADGATREQHIQRIVGTVVGSGYPGIDLDYRGIDPDLQGEYTDFITGLADALHEQGRQLSVRLELPVQIAADRWDTGAYDWRAIGAQADSVKIAVPADPNAYVPGGEMDAMLQWAVGEVNRHKLSLLVSTHSIEQTGESQKAVPFSEALAPYNQIRIEAGSTLVEPGGQVTFTMAGPGQSTGIQFDPNSGKYWSAYVGADGQEHTVWLENGASIARKLGYVAEYNLRGLAVQNLIGEENDSQNWAAISQFLNLVVPPVEDKLVVTWQVRNASGEVVAQANSQLSDPRFTWTAPVEGGEYTISAAISSDGGATAAARGSLQVAVNAP